MLVALLNDMPIGPVETIDLDGMSTRDKLFMLATCCANMIAETVWTQAHGDHALALKGIDALVVGIKDNFERRR